MDQVSLTLVGSGHPDYVAFLRELVEQEHLQGFVIFHNSISKDEMPVFLQAFDILVFPSIYQEPLARMVQEAMLSGLVVVGTNTGGTKEILGHGDNGLIFTPEDAEGLADQIERLRADPDLYDRLAQSGRKTVLEKFTLERMVGEIEAFLLECYAGIQDQKIGAELAYY
jgi:glycosyltransferase involved in cell wall biosynthesis